MLELSCDIAWQLSTEGAKKHKKQQGVTFQFNVHFPTQMALFSVYPGSKSLKSHSIANCMPINFKNKTKGKQKGTVLLYCSCGLQIKAHQRLNMISCQ